MILAIFPNDIFVTPSGGEIMEKRYGHRRIAYTGGTILKGEYNLFGENILFEEFIDRSYKLHPDVQ
ncbi:MAG: hypothetical protein WC071_08755 [Victivallaceae bacterium]